MRSVSCEGQDSGYAVEDQEHFGYKPTAAGLSYIIQRELTAIILKFPRAEMEQMWGLFEQANRISIDIEAVTSMIDDLRRLLPPTAAYQEIGRIRLAFIALCGELQEAIDEGLFSKSEYSPARAIG